jgi:hypothetical protein
MVIRGTRFRAPGAVIHPDVYGARRLIRWIAVQQLTASG